MENKNWKKELKKMTMTFVAAGIALGVMSPFGEGIVSAKTSVAPKTEATAKKKVKKKAVIVVKDVFVIGKSNEKKQTKDSLTYTVVGVDGEAFYVTFSKGVLKKNFPKKDLKGKSLQLKVSYKGDLHKNGGKVLSSKLSDTTIHYSMHSDLRNLQTSIDMYRAESESLDGLEFLDTNWTDKEVTAHVIEVKHKNKKEKRVLVGKYALVNYKVLSDEAYVRKLPAYVREYDVLRESKGEVSLAVELNTKKGAGKNVVLSGKEVTGKAAFIRNGKLIFE